MQTKEQPLIKAVSNVGALPGFLTANEYVSGFVAVTACGFFGGLVMMFQAAVGGGGAEQLFAPVRAGALAGHTFAAFVMALGWAYYAFEPDEEYRQRYCKAGLITAASWMIGWAAFSRTIYEWMVDLGPLVGSQS